MTRLIVFVVLFLLYSTYSFIVYSKGTENSVQLPSSGLAAVDKGKEIFQQYNCISCHQVYGLGGYLGPELTTAWSDKQRGEPYMRAFLKNGGVTMPNFHFKEVEIDAIIAYLHYIDSTATTYK